MSQPFLGQIQMFAGSFAPHNWALAAGQLLAIRQSTALFSLLGTNFGGNGTVTFQLPNLASLQACGSGAGPGLTPRVIGEMFGSQTVTLTTDTMPAHNHVMDSCTGSPNPTAVPAANSCISGFTTTTLVYVAPDAPAAMNPGMVLPGPIGGGQPHENLQPYLGLTFCIAMDGTFPSFN